MGFGLTRPQVVLITRTAGAEGEGQGEEPHLPLSHHTWRSGTGERFNRGDWGRVSAYGFRPQINKNKSKQLVNRPPHLNIHKRKNIVWLRLKFQRKHGT